MSQNEGVTPENAEDGSLGRVSLLITVVTGVACAAFWAAGLNLPFLFAQAVLISLVIWQACDPFADAAQWIGIQLKLPGSVRGATLDAVASSMPELFSGIFFVVVAITTTSGDGAAATSQAAQEGYGSTIATCAGSAVYNMILIPASCALVISFARRQRPTVDIEPEVLSRDGFWFLACELVLLAFLYQGTMYWWMALVFMGLYVVYIGQLVRDAKTYRRAMRVIHDHISEVGRDAPTEKIVEVLRAEGIKSTPTLVDEIRSRLARGMIDEDDEGEEEEADTAGLFFGFVEIPLNGFTAWATILVSTLISAAACYWLVEVTRNTATELAAPTFFVAVILAAAVSSVPDTFLAIGASLRGDDSGAVSNAFGSNIFDICICLSIPLLVNSYLTRWEPVPLMQDGKPLPGLLGLQVLLWSLTLVTLLIMWHNRQITRTKAIVLCLLYGVFVSYAVLGSLGYSV